MARFLNTKNLELCKSKYYEKTNDIHAYRLNRLSAWHDSIKQCLTDTLVGTVTIDKDVLGLLLSGCGRLELTNQMLIDKVVGYYKQPEGYVAQLKEKSELKGVGKEASVGFTHFFAQGRNRGKHVIGFTDEDALVDCLGEAGLTKGLVPEFMRRMIKSEMALNDADGRLTLKVDVDGEKLDCYVLLDPRYHGSSEVPGR